MHVVRAGLPAGPPLLFIHGSAADHTTWTMQLASPLRERFALVAYDRPVRASVEAHADDAAVVAGDRPVIAIGSSFGAVIALELARRHPAVVRGLVLCEPPMAASDAATTELEEFAATFDRIAAEQGGEAAAEHFLREVLSDAGYERMPAVFQARSRALWREIGADTAALAAYRPRYAELGAVTVPVRLVGGERSLPYFRPTLEALLAALPRARLEILPGAGHMLHAEAARRFHALIADFADELAAVPDSGQSAPLP